VEYLAEGHEPVIVVSGPPCGCGLLLSSGYGYTPSPSDRIAMNVTSEMMLRRQKILNMILKAFVRVAKRCRNAWCFDAYEETKDSNLL
jgi:hypothetical protein